MTALHTRLFGLLATSWGAILIYFYHSTRVKDYLAADFHHFILFGGIGMIILGVYSIINPQPKKDSHPEINDHDHDADCAHDHHADGLAHPHEHEHEHEDCESGDHHHEEGHGPLVTILLTIIPLTLAMSHTRDKLSNQGLSKKGLYETPALTNAGDIPPFTREDLEKRVSKNQHGEFELRMITAYYAAGDREIQDIFDGLPVELEGRIAPEKINNEAGDRMRVFRSIITCCAADLQVVGVSLQFPERSTRPKFEDWVKAGGILTFETVNGTVLPLLKVREVVQAEEPYSEFQLRQ
jgi:uncharacterized repeat protein (TIGR03943 family)|tara:strand:+ start:834 stop:1721 length:888 start_codon:yes stop_codon:yes gene_type:complete